SGFGPPAAPAGRVPSATLRRATLEVSDLVGLPIGLLLRVRELVLRLALALLLAALAAQGRVVGEVACGLLDAACDLVGDAHVGNPPSSGVSDLAYPGAERLNRRARRPSAAARAPVGSAVRRAS